MARPKKETIDYFPHYVADGKTLFILESTYGNDGYAFWFKLLEILGSSEGHFYDCNNSFNWRFLISKTRVSEEIAIEMLDTLAELEAIDHELWQDRIIWVQNLVNNVADLYKRRNSPLPQKPIKCRQKSEEREVFVDINPTSPDVSDNKNPQSIVKDSKVNQSIGEKDIKSDSAEADPTQPECPQKSILDHWNSKKLVEHRKLNDKIKRAINGALKDYSKTEILQAIEHYAVIVSDDRYFWSHKWTLKEFLERGIDKFLKWEVCSQNYLKERDGPNGKGGQHGSKDLPKLDRSKFVYRGKESELPVMSG